MKDCARSIGTNDKRDSRNNEHGQILKNMTKTANAKKSSLTAKQRKVIGALLMGGTVANAAKLAHVSERNIYRMLERDEFTTALADASEKAIEAAARMLADASNVAVLTLREIATKKNAADGARVRASDVILAHMLKVNELHEIERRLSELERLQNAKHHDTTRKN